MSQHGSKKNSISDAPKNLDNMIQRINILKDAKSREIIVTVFQRNGYFRHGENILIAMINDENPIIRELGW